MPAAATGERRSLAARLKRKAQFTLYRGPVARDERATWMEAQSLSDLCYRMESWLSGGLKSQPGYYGSVDVDEEEAPGLTDACRRLNRVGFLTDNSQAGQVGERSVQLAAVDGFVTPATLARLQTALAGTPYRIEAFEDPQEYGAKVPVTWEDGEPFTWFGGGCPAADVRELWGGSVGAGAVDDLCDALQVVIYDPSPGRNTLWADLRARL
jgi:hypothetical protein